MVAFGQQQRKQHRVSVLRDMFDKDVLGLEVGPSFRPVAPKSEGYKVETVDHATAEELRRKYAGKPSAAVQRIEEVDYVWQGGSLVDLIGTPGRYSYIIASHVIEHTTDIVRFLQDCEALLKPDGVLILAVPDKRYCFDYFRPVSTAGEAVAAYLEKRDRHSVSTLFNHFSTIVRNGRKGAWDKADPISELLLVHDVAKGMHIVEQSRQSEAYIDAHAWQFTPSSFRLMLADLRSVNLTGLWENRLIDGLSCEFFVRLTKVPGQESARLDLLQATLQEQAGQEQAAVLQQRPWTSLTRLLRRGLRALRKGKSS